MQRSTLSKCIRAALVSLLIAAPILSIAWMMYAVSWDYLLGIRGISAAFSFLRPYGSAIAISGWAIFVGLVAIFPLWLNDVSKLISERSSLPFSAQRAAFSFFVPLQQIGLPYQIFKSLCFRLNRRLGADALLISWSIAWVVMLAAGIAYALTDLFHIHSPHIILLCSGSTVLLHCSAL